ncbi:MAG: hypothetical protein J6A97_05675 [Clostridia bacterium]|nr:hypothetical protein [Clostridia bacterium]
MKKFLSVIFSVIFIYLSLPIVNASITTNIDEGITTTYIDYTEIKTADISKIKNSIELTFLSTEDKVIYIFEKLNVNNVEKSGLFSELVDDFDYLSKIVTSTSYYELQNSDGAVKQISRQEYFSNKLKKTSRDVSIGEETISENGYMSISTSAIFKTNEAIGTYSFLSVFSWLDTPYCREIDAVSLASNEITWLNNSNGNHTFILIAPFSSILPVGDNAAYTFEKNQADYIDENGCYFTFDLPDDTPTKSYEDIMVIISSKGRVTEYNTPNQMLSLSAKYAHIQLQSPFDASFSWDIINGGVSIEAGAIIKKYYNNYFSWDYSDHYYTY